VTLGRHQIQLSHLSDEDIQRLQMFIGASRSFWSMHPSVLSVNEIRRDDRVLYDSPLEEDGFELSVPRSRKFDPVWRWGSISSNLSSAATQMNSTRLNAKSRRSSIQALPFRRMPSRIRSSGSIAADLIGTGR
jgi:hypothetical protein